MRRIIFPLLLGIAGVAVLVSLGSWQVQRLSWKEGILTEINNRIAAAPVAMPAAPTEDADEYRPVTLSGLIGAVELHVLTSGTKGGTGYRAIAPMVLDDGRRILLDQGLLALNGKDQPATARQASVTGTLLWPDDVNSSTPDPDLGRNIWFGRDVTAMSKALETEPLMVVASTIAPLDPRLTLLPIDTAQIKNDHLEYAITWFSLALVWAIMSIVLILRTLRPKEN